MSSPSLGTTDVAGQIAIVQGVDSNVFQTQSPGGEPIVRHPSAFTSLETSLGLLGSGRLAGDSSDLRMFGRFVTYEPLGVHAGEWESRTGRAGLSHHGSARLDRKTTLLTTLLGSVGSLQAARGTDGALAEIDPISTRRSTWSTGGSVTFVVETSRVTTVRALTGVDVTGTLTETLFDGSKRRGLDFLVARSRFSVQHGLDARTFLEGALLVERLHSEYVIVAGNPASRSAATDSQGGSAGVLLARRPIDGGDATATIGISRLIERRTTANGGVGVTFAIPQFGEPATALPVASAGLLHTETDWSASLLGSFQYTLSQPRVGPGATTSVTSMLIGRPLPGHARDALEVVAEAGGQRTGILIGPNEGSSVTSFGGSLTLRWAIAGGFGLLFGYDLRASHLSSGADDASQPWYVRHLGFAGLSYAFASSGAVSTLPTLARPSSSPFTP